MIVYFHGYDRYKYPELTKQMFHLRAKVFSVRLGWNVQVVDGLECDEFDEMNPLYLVALKNGEVVGCMRLLPTTGPTLLNGPLAKEFDDCVDIRSPVVFECTRFATDDITYEITPCGVGHTTVELLIANCLLMRRAGILQVLGVVDTRTLPIYRRFGWVPTIFAKADKPDFSMVVGLWDAGAQTLSRLLERHGVEIECYEDAIIMKTRGRKLLATA